MARVRAFARFRGTHAKSDPIGVGVIGDFARSSDKLRLYEPPRPEQIELCELVARRTELRQEKEAELARVEHVGSPQVIGRQRRLDDDLVARHGPLPIDKFDGNRLVIIQAGCEGPLSQNFCGLV